MSAECLRALACKGQKLGPLRQRGEKKMERVICKIVCVCACVFVCVSEGCNCARAMYIYIGCVYIYLQM